MHYLLFFMIGIVLASDDLSKLEQCWDKSLQMLDQAKSDLDGNYDHDPWYIKHQAQSAECRKMRDAIKDKKSDHKFIICIPNENRKHKCRVEKATKV
jgi:hypothetical protein